MDALLRPEALIAVATLAALEIVLGIDNLVFVAIQADRLPKERRSSARKIGLIAALGTRLVLLASVAWLTSLTRPLFAVLGVTFTGEMLVLLAGGLFLIFKATREIYDFVELKEEELVALRGGAPASFGMVIAQIAIMDIIFSLDSILTAVGMTKEFALMVVAIVIAMGVMVAAADAVSGFIERHPSVKMLALSFLLLIGVLLIVQGTGRHVDKAYIYFAMAFSLAVELFNMRYRTNRARRKAAAAARRGDPVVQSE